MHINNKEQRDAGRIYKIQQSFFDNYEKIFVRRISLATPFFIKSHHLTLTTMLWIFLVIIFSFLARHNSAWILGSSMVILLHCLTDSLDIEIAKREKDSGKNWNFYMDHILDYFFLVAIIIGYSLAIPSFNGYILAFSLIVSCGLMTDSFLYLATANRFKISHFKMGPTEGKLLFVGVNFMIIFLEEKYILFFIKFLVLFLAAVLITVVYKNQCDLRKRPHPHGRERVYR